VVVAAYQRLAEEGLAIARVGAGTLVAPLTARSGRAAATPGRQGSRPPTLRLDGGAGLEVPPLGAPGAITYDLSPGLPDLAAFPREAWLRAERHVLSQATDTDLGYGDPRGNPMLRRELAAWLGRIRGVRTDPDGVLVVAGVAQSLALLGQTLYGRGFREIAVEDPGSRGARDNLTHWGLRPVPVPVDGDGLRVDALSASGARAVKVTPAHQFPTGVLLAAHRRHELLAWARPGHLVIEDDYDAEHRYDRTPVPALQASAPDLVAHTGSTSKTLAPGLRLGWLVPPSAWLEQLVAAKHASDLTSPALPQLVLAHLFAGGEHDRHLRRVRARQRERRDALVTALHRELPGARIGGIAAGLHILITLPGERRDDSALAELAAEAGVRLQPLSWHRVAPGPPGLVVGYAANTPDRLSAAAAVLGRVLRRD
jgi:GntR family transcriptional regulator/MocR family aminotransferase